MDYLDIPYCKRRTGSYKVAARFYNEPHEDRTLRVWYGNFV